jgi:trans-aconitate methyltransferase
MSDRDFWNARFKASGHTGWSNPWLYAYDQRNRINALKALIQRIDPSSVMDIGCGTGDFVELVKQECPACNITAIDISNEAIASSRKRFAGVEGVSFYAEDLQVAEFDTEHYDLLVSITVLQHITDHKELHKLLKKIGKALRPNGCFVFLENVYHGQEKADSFYLNKSFSAQDWVKACQGAGLKVSTHSPYPQWGVILVESTLAVLSKFKRMIQSIGNRSNCGVNDIAKLNQLPQPPGRLLALVTRMVLGFAMVLDQVIKLPVPKRLAKYEVFVCTT